MPPSNQDLFKLFLTPQQDSYSLARTRDGFIRVELDGGQGRYRRDILGSTGKVTVKWTLDPDDYMYLWAFYRVFLDDMRKFKIDLILEDEGLVECTAWFHPGTFKLNKQQATTYFCQATLEVEPPEYEIKTDYDLVQLIELFGKNWRYWLDRLQIIVNIDWPKTIPYKP